MTNVLGSTHVVEQLSFSMFPLIQTFDFDLIFGSFWLFGAPMSYTLGGGNFWFFRGKGLKRLIWESR